MKKDQSSESSAGIAFFKYSKNVEIICDINLDKSVIIEIIISENSINELAETTDKFINLFKKY